MTDNKESKQPSPKKKMDFKLMGVSLLVLVGIGVSGIYMKGKDQESTVAKGDMAQMESYYDADSTAKVGGMNDVTPATGDENPVVAIVNGSEIHRNDIMPMMEQALQGQMGQLGVGMDQLFPLFLDQYVSGELVLQEAKRADTDDTDRYKEQMELTQEQIMRNVFLVNMADEKVTETALKKLYAEKITELPDEQEIKASHILVKEEGEAKAIIKQLKGGADFAELAKEKSTGPTGPKGGDLGYFAKGDMVAEFAEAAFSLDTGEVTSEPVKTQFGWHVIKVTDQRERPKPAFDEVRDQLEEALRKQILDEYLQTVRESAEVTLFDFNGNPIQASEPASGEAMPETDKAE